MGSGESSRWRLGRLPATFELATPSGGAQLTWKAPRGREFRTCAGQVAPQFDVRGRDGLFVLWDPTQPGRFVTDDREPAEMPSWLAEFHPEPGSLNGHGKIADMPNGLVWLEENGDGEPCELMTRTRNHWLDRLESGDGKPHNVMAYAVNALIGDCVAGQRWPELRVGGGARCVRQGNGRQVARA